MLPEFEAGHVQEMPDVLKASRRQIVDTDHVMTGGEQSLAQMGTEKSCATRNKYSLNYIFLYTWESDNITSILSNRHNLVAHACSSCTDYSKPGAECSPSAFSGDKKAPAARILIIECEILRHDVKIHVWKKQASEPDPEVIMVTYTLISLCA
jgi:hypothetical protein